MSSTNPNYLGDGVIGTCLFVAQAPSSDNRVIQCTANLQPVGISGSATDTPPLPNATGYACSAAGLPVRVHGEGEQALLTYGATVTRGNYLASDANGKGTPIATSGVVQTYGAVALESGITSDIRNVQVRLGKTPATAS